MNTRYCNKPLRKTADVEGFADESSEPFDDYVPDPLENIKRPKYTQAAWGDVFDGACDGVDDDDLGGVAIDSLGPAADGSRERVHTNM